tara:strand:+ start:299 stop:463 length:165 start_codon:yes stop_codon:yes gene_type:complete
MENKIPMTARLPVEVSDAMEKARKDKNHRFYDRANAYIINKVMSDWVKKENKNG